MSKDPTHLSQPEGDVLLRRLSGRPVDLADIKARRYVGRFFHRRRVGRRIAAEVEGNHGTYSVSISVGARGVSASCSCYVGARGECHHVRALSQTFMEEPETFAPQETRTRRQLRTLDDLQVYLESASLETLLVELHGRGLDQGQLRSMLGMGRRTLGDALQGEKQGDPSNTAGALKLACLYLLEWREAETGRDGLSRALSGRSRRELLDLIEELAGALAPRDRDLLLARLNQEKESPSAAPRPDGEDFLAEIDDFIADCEKGLYYDWGEVAAYREDRTGHYQPEMRAFDLLDGFFSRADRYHRAGEDGVAVAAYEKLLDILSENAGEWFGLGEISGWLETDLRQATAHYLVSLGRVCSSEEYVARARHRIGWTHPDLLVTESRPEQCATLEADLLREIESGAEPGDHAPYAVTLLRQLYDHQGRTEESLGLCRRWRHHYPALRVPLMDHAESVGDWQQLETLAREALSQAEGRGRALWASDHARSRLEQRLGRALERQGQPAEALTHAQLAFRSQPDAEGYRRVTDLAARISGELRARAVGEIVDFLEVKVHAEELRSPSRWASRETVLLARILLAEGRDAEAFDLAMDVEGSTQIRLLNLVGGFYLEVGAAQLRAPATGGVSRWEALLRAGDCYHRLVQLYVDARGRDNYAVAATYADVMREIYRRRDRAGEFDRWYAGFMGNHRRFRALREEFRRRLGPEPEASPTPAA
ncbi:MAG: hypothetical protein ACYC66_06335 [Chloroflexota bacterium]